MKKITFFLTSAFFSLSVISSASADNYKYRPYIGIDYVKDKVSIDHFKPEHHALGLRIGTDYTRYFGTEVFFTQSNAFNENRRVRQGEHLRLKTSYRSYGLDVLAYLPLGCEVPFSLAATAGIGEYTYRERMYPNKHHEEHGYGYRFGGGFRYMISQNWFIRGLARYVKFDRLGDYDDAMEYTAGVDYHF